MLRNRFSPLTLVVQVEIEEVELDWCDYSVLQQITIKRVCVQSSKALPELDLVNCSCGGLDPKLLYVIS